MLDRVSADSDQPDRHDDSVDTLDSLHGAGPGLPASMLPIAVGDITLPSSLPRHPDDSRPTSSTGSKPTTEASTLPIRGVRSPSDLVHQLMATGPADSVRDTAGMPVCGTDLLFRNTRQYVQ